MSKMSIQSSPPQGSYNLIKEKFKFTVITIYYTTVWYILKCRLSKGFLDHVSEKTLRLGKGGQKDWSDKLNWKKVRKYKGWEEGD